MDLSNLASMVAEKTGFDERALSQRRLLILAKRLEHEAVSEEDLASCPSLEEWASEAVSVGETYFFRQAEHFEFLMGRVAAWSAAEKPMLAWSAGCSTGEEAWSIAAALSAWMQPGYPIEVLGTDMSERSLVAAREGFYGRWSMRREGAAMPTVLQGMNADRMEVLPELRRLVRFERHNLLDPAPLEGRKARLIFCRNVLIYLSPQAARRVIANLVESLEDDGLLVLGTVDIDFVPPGLVPEDPRVLQIYQRAKRIALQTMIPPVHEEAKAAPEAFDPKALHLLALQEAEAGHDADALALLLELRSKASQYLPGLFDLAMTLSRKGAKREAAATLENLLELASEKDLQETIDAPEPVSLIFYVTSAQTFLERYGRIA
jgi:chemotaxis protein methyltransferase CheR